MLTRPYTDSKRNTGHYSEPSLYRLCHTYYSNQQQQQQQTDRQTVTSERSMSVTSRKLNQHGDRPTRLTAITTPTGRGYKDGNQERGEEGEDAKVEARTSSRCDQCSHEQPQLGRAGRACRAAHGQMNQTILAFMVSVINHRAGLE